MSKSIDTGYVYAPYIPLQVFWHPTFVAVKEKLKNSELRYFQPQFISDFGMRSSAGDQFIIDITNWADSEIPKHALDVFSMWFPIIP